MSAGAAVPLRPDSGLSSGRERAPTLLKVHRLHSRGASGEPDCARSLSRGCQSLGDPHMRLLNDDHKARSRRRSQCRSRCMSPFLQTIIASFAVALALQLGLFTLNLHCVYSDINY